MGVGTVGVNPATGEGATGATRIGVGGEFRPEGSGRFGTGASMRARSISCLVNWLRQKAPMPAGETLIPCEVSVAAICS